MLIFTVIQSCQKDNDLEDSMLGVNVFDGPSVHAFEVAGTQVNCNLVYLDITLKEELIPPGFTFTHILIEDPFGNQVKTTKRKLIFVNALCNQLNEFKVYLHQESPSKSSKANVFFFQTKS